MCDRGQCLGSSEATIQMYDKAIQLNPERHILVKVIQYYYDLGDLFYRIHKYEEAIQMCDRVIQIDRYNLKDFYLKGSKYIYDIGFIFSNIDYTY